MKRTAIILALLFILALASLPVQAESEPQQCAPVGIPWGAGTPGIQPESFPFLCQKCQYCFQPILIYQYSVCWTGYFDGCGGSYPNCREPWHIKLWHTCNCN